MDINGSVNKPHFNIGGDIRQHDASRTTGDAKVPAPHFQTNSTPDVSQHVPVRELTKLQERLNERESVRQDRVSQIKEKFASGFYSTPESAEQTASAILNRIGIEEESGGTHNQSSQT